MPNCKGHGLEIGPDGYVMGPDQETAHTEHVCLHESLFSAWFRLDELQQKHSSLLRRYEALVPALRVFLGEDPDA